MHSLFLSGSPRTATERHRRNSELFAVSSAGRSANREIRAAPPITVRDRLNFPRSRYLDEPTCFPFWMHDRRDGPGKHERWKRMGERNCNIRACNRIRKIIYRKSIRDRQINPRRLKLRGNEPDFNVSARIKSLLSSGLLADVIWAWGNHLKNREEINQFVGSLITSYYTLCRFIREDCFYADRMNFCSNWSISYTL